MTIKHLFVMQCEKCPRTVGPMQDEDLLRQSAERQHWLIREILGTEPGYYRIVHLCSTCKIAWGQKPPYAEAPK